MIIFIILLLKLMLMKHDYGLSVCVSSQVGCNMGCAFCESGRLKKVRNLESFEIIEQILLISEDINERIIPHVLTVMCLAPIAKPNGLLTIFIKLIILS